MLIDYENSYSSEFCIVLCPYVLSFQSPTETNLSLTGFTVCVLPAGVNVSSLTSLSLSLSLCRCVRRSLCIDMEYSADCKLYDRECRQATLITGVQ